MLRACHREEYRVHPKILHPVRSGAVPALLLAVAFAVTGCASQGKVTGSWAEGADRDQTFKRVLVVGVSPDLDARCNFERFLAARIRSEDTVAMTSCASVTKRDPLTRESIEEAVKAKQADAVVATILVSKDWHMKKGGDMDTRGGGGYKDVDSGWADYYGFYGVYGVPVIYGEFQTAPSVFTMKGEVRVTSKLFDTSGASVVYTMDTVAKDVESRDRGLSMVASAIAKRLQKDGLVR